MQFIWYGALPLLLLIPLLALGYWYALRHRSRFAVRYASLNIVRHAVAKKQRIRRHIPPTVFLAALACMLLAVARPFTLVPGSESGATVILTIDISASMMGTDIEPSRLEAAKAAVRDFVMQQSPNLLIGVVAFSDSASLVQIPTSDRAAVLSAVERLQTQSSTAIGDGILSSLYAIANAANRAGMPVEVAQETAIEPAEDGKLSGAIILLTDGQNEVGASPIDAAHEAERRGVRVYTVGIGSNNVRISRRSRARVEFDESTLTQIADITHGKFFRAFDESSLSEVYKNLHPQFTLKQERAELAPVLAGIAAALVLASGILSHWWNGGIP